MKFTANTTPNCNEVIEEYRALAENSEFATLKEFGSSDAGLPLHLLMIDAKKEFDPATAKKNGRNILFINNGIHPGEPCGIDASLLFIKDLLKDTSGASLPENTMICIIPIYNIGGALNRNSTSRANQNGPEEYGFRANAKNLDLNRDFIKCDSKNAQTFSEIFQYLQPDLFIDTHTSNGADYQYTMTLITTHPDKLEKVQGDLLRNTLLPFLEKNMEEAGYPMIPYVDFEGETPESGLISFMDYGRYSTGYASLFNTIGFMPEAHMLKPYPERVLSTYAFLRTALDFLSVNGNEMRELRDKANEKTSRQKEFVIQWELNRDKFDRIPFKGYEAEHPISEVTGLQRLSYNNEKPFEREVNYYTNYKPKLRIRLPEYYIIPQAWNRLIEILQSNNVELKRLSENVERDVEYYYIDDYKTVKSPYEGHYLHYDVELSSKKIKSRFYKGDYVVACNQVSNRYLAAVLEPGAPDSFFAWNFFDSVLQQKEYFSPYVFEDLALEILNENPQLKKEFELQKANDQSFANDSYKQLTYIYERSEYYESGHKRYPIALLREKTDLPLEF